MGKFLKRFKNAGHAVDNRVNKYAQNRENRPQEFRGGKIHDKRPEKLAEGVYDGFEDEFNEDNDARDLDYDRYDEVGIQQAQ